MRRPVAIFLLAGAFVASASLNIYHTVRGYSARANASAEVPVSGKRICPSLQELGLTPGQREKLAGCCGMCANRRDELQKKIASLIAELERELNASSLNVERVYGLADQVGELRAQELKSRIHSIVQVRETLTPSQLERLVAAVAVKEPFPVPEGAKEKGE